MSRAYLFAPIRFILFCILGEPVATGAGTEVGKADVWWCHVLERVDKECAPDTARLQVLRAEKARIAAAEAKQKAAEESRRKAEEAARAAEAEAPEPDIATATPQKKAGCSRGSPAKRSPGRQKQGSPSKGSGKSPGGGRKGKAKGGRIPDAWDSDDSEFEDEDEEVSSEEDEPEPEEEGMEERVVRFFKDQLDAVCNMYNTPTAGNALSVRGRFHTVMQLRDALLRHFQKLTACAPCRAVLCCAVPMRAGGEGARSCGAKHFGRPWAARRFAICGVAMLVSERLGGQVRVACADCVGVPAVSIDSFQQEHVKALHAYSASLSCCQQPRPTC